MTPDLDQIADEAIELRHRWIEGSIAVRATQGNPRMEAHGRSIATNTWPLSHPALDALAEHRLTALARLADRGITPGPEATATAGGVRLGTIQDPAPCSHRYVITRAGQYGEEAIGTAWLSTDRDLTAGTYVAALTGERTRVYGSCLQEALQRMAQLLANAPAGAR